MFSQDEASSAQTVASFPSVPLQPPILADLNRDGVEDVIFCLDNATMALNLAVGAKERLLWMYHANPNVQECVGVAAGDFDGDGVPDVAASFSIPGPHDLGFTQVMHRLDVTMRGKKKLLSWGNILV